MLDFYGIIRKNSDTLRVTHTNVFRSTISDDVKIRYTTSDGEDPMFGHAVQLHDLLHSLTLCYS